MTISRRTLLRYSLLCASFLCASFGASFAVISSAAAQSTIKIGEINSYKAQPAFLEPYRQGWQLALDEINGSGGVLGKKLEVIARDDNGNPGDSVRVAEELLKREQVSLLFGGFLSNTGLALTDYARQRKVFFLAAEPLTDKIIWQNGNKYTYRLRPSTSMQVSALVKEAIKLKKKRWALVYPNYEYGQSAMATFKSMMKQAQPDIEFVAEQATPLGKVDAAAVTQALIDGTDLARFVREGDTRGLFASREVVSVLSGEPEYLDPLKEEAPRNWIVTGYPWYALTTPEHKKFVDAYRKIYNDYPRTGSLVGYSAMMSLAAGLRKAGSVDSDKLAAAFSGLQVETPLGPIVYRSQDHQSTLGIFVGRTGVKDGHGVMSSFTYLDGATLQLPDAEVKKLRAAD